MIRRVLLAALLVAVVALPVGTAPVSTAAAVEQPVDQAALRVPLRVMTYDIHVGIGDDGRLDLERTAATIRESGAEVVGIEEADVHWANRSAWADQVAELSQLLGMKSCFAPIYSFDPPAGSVHRAEFGVAVLSQHPIVSCENHNITRLSTQVPNPNPAPAPGFAEAVIEARGARVHVYVTHLDYRADPAVRQLQVEDTLRILAKDEPGAAQLLLGDFNAESDAAELAPLWERLTDAWNFTDGVDSGLTFPAVTPVKRIDYVATSDNITVLTAAVVDSSASDHRPVVADLVIRRLSRSTS